MKMFTIRYAMSVDIDANSEEEAIDLAMDKAMEDFSFEVVGVEEYED